MADKYCTNWQKNYWKIWIRNNKKSVGGSVKDIKNIINTKSIKLILKLHGDKVF